MGWKNLLYKTGSYAERNFDRFKLSFRHRAGWETNIQICPYITYCNSETLYIKGRVLQDKGIDISNHDTAWENILNMYHRFNSNEIPGAVMKLTFSKTTKEITSDEDGYFEAEIPLVQALPAEELWHHPLLELLSAPVPFSEPVMARCEVMTPPATAQLGVISDIDDTILVANASSILKMAYMTFFKNAYSRLPFKGIASLLHAFQQGFTGASYNPVFYVSGSPWNLYDLLTDFIKINKMPAGPLLLKDYGFTRGKYFTESHEKHKAKAITNILNAFPSLQFILIGDSGEKDPEIFAGIIRQFPGRILSSYIRDVSKNERDKEITGIAASLEADHEKMHLVADSYEAALHAFNKGYISLASHKLLTIEKNTEKKAGSFENVINAETDMPS